MDRENRDTIVFIGDSITDCDRLWDRDSLGLGRGYVRLIAEKLGANVRVKNRGHNGFTAFRVGLHLEEDCLRFQPAEVSLLVGINDLAAFLDGAGGYDAREYRSHLDHILQRIRENGTRRLTVMEPFLFPEPAEYLSWMEPLAGYQEAAREAAEQAEARFLPLAELFREAEKHYPLERLTKDGIHLTALGHRLLAEKWLSGRDFSC